MACSRRKAGTLIFWPLLPIGRGERKRRRPARNGHRGTGFSGRVDPPKLMIALLLTSEVTPRVSEGQIGLHGPYWPINTM